MRKSLLNRRRRFGFLAARLRLASLWLLVGVLGCLPVPAPPDEPGVPDDGADFEKPEPPWQLPVHWSEIEPALLADHLSDVLTVAATDAAYWAAKPTLNVMLGIGMDCVVDDHDREIARRLLAGEFQASPLFPWEPIGVPPPWAENPFDSRTFDAYRHGLLWLIPLAKVGFCEGDAASRDLVQTVVADWIAENSRPPGPSDFSWSDGSAAARLRVFCWLWETARQTGHALPDDFKRLLIASAYQHAEYLASGEAYNGNSNHALMVDGALLTVAVTFPEFDQADAWQRTAASRLAAYIDRNFSAGGFNLEQSAGYHWYVLWKLLEVDHFVRGNDVPTIGRLATALADGFRVWPYLVRGDGSIVTIGDTGGGARLGWRRYVAAVWDYAAPPPATSTFSNPRGDGSSFLLDEEVGYAIFTSYPIEGAEPDDDVHVLFRCDSWYHSTHCHMDALSFELYGLGREWLIDAGRYNYEGHDPIRRYMRSARAHNVVLVDDAAFEFEPVELLDAGRTADGDFAVARHDLPQATHARRFTFVPPNRIELHDELVARNGQPHVYTQLFHVEPTLAVEIVSDELVRLVAPNADTCVIEQLGGTGTWSTVRGQESPYVQGWFSRAFDEVEPCTTLRYSAPPAARHEFRTRITLVPAD